MDTSLTIFLLSAVIVLFACVILLFLIVDHLSVKIRKFEKWIEEHEVAHAGKEL